MIYTGGTIGMVKGEDNSLKPFDFEKLTAEIPELKKFDVELNAIAFKKPIDSSNMNPKMWLYLANLIGNHYQALRWICYSSWLRYYVLYSLGIEFFTRRFM